MSDVELVVCFITKLYIIMNASRLGWLVEVKRNKIILTKCLDDLTGLDKDTPKLIGALFNSNTDIYHPPASSIL
jgi:hypothetical protein